MTTRGEVAARLIEEARKAAESAYCPYSKFRVGAAVLADGKLFTGCNVENASYSLVICAERVAIFKAIASGARTISALAVACPDADPTEKTSVVPCGSCRQVMAEFASKDFVVILDDLSEFGMGQLLPLAFNLNREL